MAKIDIGSNIVRNHSSERIQRNALSPQLHNEYARVMGELIDAIGDVSQFPLLSTSISESFVNLQDSYNTSFTTNKLTVLGSADLGALKFTWKGNSRYAEGDIVLYDGKLLSCDEDHTSIEDGGKMVTEQLGLWKPIGGGGSTSVDVNVDGHGFNIGEVLFYYDGYMKALANNQGSLGLFIVSDVIDANNFTIMQTGYFELPDGSSLSHAMVDGSSNFKPNTWYYLSDEHHGKLTDVEPHISNPILYAATETVAFVIGYRPVPVTIPDVYEFIYTSGTTEYELPYSPRMKKMCNLVAGGVVQYNGDYDIDGNTLIIYEDFADLTPMRFEYRTTEHHVPSASVEEYKFITTSGQTEFVLDYAPISSRHLFFTSNGVLYDTDDYYLQDNIVHTYNPFPENQRVKILDLRASRIVSPDLENIGENTIPGNRLQQESIPYNRLEPDIQVLLRRSEDIDDRLIYLEHLEVKEHYFTATLDTSYNVPFSIVKKSDLLAILEGQILHKDDYSLTTSGDSSYIHFNEGIITSGDMIGLKLIRNGSYIHNEYNDTIYAEHTPVDPFDYTFETTIDQSSYILPEIPPSKEHLLMFVNGVDFSPEDYTLNGANLVFLSGTLDTDIINYVHIKSTLSWNYITRWNTPEGIPVKIPEFNTTIIEDHYNSDLDEYQIQLSFLPGSKSEIFIVLNGIVLQSDSFSLEGDIIKISPEYIDVGYSLSVKTLSSFTTITKTSIDSVQSNFGIYHDGSHGFIENNYGDLFIDTVHPSEGLTGGCIRSRGKIYNAVWNDYADYWDKRKGTVGIPGLCYSEYGKGLELPNKNSCPAVIGVCSDTYGHAVGWRENAIPIAVAGYVLAFVDKVYSAGTILTNRKDGTLTKASFFDIILQRGIAKYMKLETNQYYNKVLVNGRHWVKVI